MAILIKKTMGYIRIKKIRPMFTALVTTKDEYGKGDIEIGIKPYQRIIAVGDSVRNIKVGDVVCINPIRYAKMKHKEGSLKDGIIGDNPVVEYNIPTVEIDGMDYLLIDNADIRYVIEDYEEITAVSNGTEKKIII